MMSPLSLPPLAVVTPALVPPFRVFCSMSASAVSTVISVGSSSHFPALPEGAAAVILVFSSILTLAPEVSMKPPSPPCGAEASRVPPTLTVPPSRRITPLTLLTVCALITPLLLTTVFKSASLVPALMTTRPPAAVMVPELVALPPAAPVSTVRLTSWSPLKSSETAWPAPSAVTLAAMAPAFLTCGPSSTASPVAVMVPWLVTLPEPVPLKVYWPLKKSLSLMSSVEATRPPVLTWEPGANRMPLGLMRKTLPLALRVP
ncbi:hypothetical protein SAMN04490355_103221 [Pelosinus propionicus DSM 13327]|uniref:Uncharacterized protein n=1 Tax=Pelosinus propionicus DSM 13327 TaxID=1123291 RepID=A0A1I4MC41_9FIRM|nr:hypothetical protein SAMN04490355_103221 [Pelosinus propionicus DSM 13327]